MDNDVVIFFYMRLYFLCERNVREENKQKIVSAGKITKILREFFDKKNYN